MPLVLVVLCIAAGLAYKSEIQSLLSTAGQIVALNAAFALLLNALFALMASKIRIKIGQIKAFGSVAFALSWAATFILLISSYALIELIIRFTR